MSFPTSLVMAALDCHLGQLDTPDTTDTFTIITTTSCPLHDHDIRIPLFLCFSSTTEMTTFIDTYNTLSLLYFEFDRMAQQWSWWVDLGGDEDINIFLFLSEELELELWGGRLWERAKGE